MRDIERWYFYLKGNLEQLASNPSVIAIVARVVVFLIVLSISLKALRASPARKKGYRYK